MMTFYLRKYLNGQETQNHTWTQPCLPRNVEGRPNGRPNLNGKLWIPADNRTDSPPVNKKIKIIARNKAKWYIFTIFVNGLLSSILNDLIGITLFNILSG
jgi:hypothetical protein